MVFIYEGFRLVLQISMASTERIYTNSNYTAWKCNAYKRITVLESAIPNPCYSIRDVDTREGTTVKKDVILNACHTWWNINTREGTTALKSSIPNPCYSIRDVDTREGTTVIKSVILNACHTV